MKRFILLVIVMSVMLTGLPAWGIDLPLPPSPFEVLESFHKAVGDFFGFEDPVLKQVLKTGLPDEELPVALFISTLAGVSPNNIIAVRRGGVSWMDVCLKFGITADRFYIPVDSGPPYGKAWGYYREPKHKWKAMRFSDDDIVNLVNLRFMNGYYGYSPSEVMDMRERGEGFVNMHQKARGQGKGPGGKFKGNGKGGHPGKGPGGKFKGNGKGGHPGKGPGNNGPQGKGQFK